MKIGYLSDIHVEFTNQRAVALEEPVDVLILAGDISTKGRGLLWAYETYREHARYIVVVFGNHDYWGGTYQKIIAEARLLADAIPNLFFLEQDAVCIEGVWFIGGTTWTDYRLGPGPVDYNEWMAENSMNDFDRIKWNGAPNHYRKMRAADLRHINGQTKKFIFDKLDEIEQVDGGPTVVITHHGPTFKSLDPAYVGSKLNPAYVNVWEHDILERGPDAWIHGHVHHESVYQVGRTVVMCNPIGYPDQLPGSKIKFFTAEVSDD